MTIQPMGTVAQRITSSVPQRLADLYDTHPWMDPQTATALATSPTDDQTMHTVAGTFADALKATWDGFTDALDDPVLHKQPSTKLQLAQYLTASLGPLPVAQTDLTELQQQMKAQGFAQGLPADGVWDAGWNSEYNAYARALIDQQLAGDKLGSVPLSKVENALMSIMPKKSGNAILGFFKSIPGDLRSLVADMAGNTQAIGQYISRETGLPSLMGDASPADVAGTVAGSIRRGLGENISDAQAQNLTVDPHEMIADIGTLLLLTPFGPGGTAAKMAQGILKAGLDREAVERGPGMIARTLFGGRTKAQIAEGAAGRGVFNNKVINNIQILGKVGPLAGKLADADGWYYRTRTVLAKPYTFRVVGQVGKAAQVAGLYGGAVRGVANLAGPGTALGGQVQDEHTLDTVDANIRRITGTPFDHHFSLGLDDLALVLHGPAEELSAAASKTARTFMAHTSDALGKIDAYGMLEMATGLKKADYVKLVGGDEAIADRLLLGQIADNAAAHYAERQTIIDNVPYGSQDWYDRIGEYNHAVWADEVLHAEAMKGMLASPYDLASRIQGNIAKTGLDPATWVKSNMLAYATEGSRLTRLIEQGAGQYLYGGQGKAVINAARDAFDYGGDIEGHVGPRVGELTRADYIREVTKLHGKILKVFNQGADEIANKIATAATPQKRAAWLSKQANLQRAIEHDDFNTALPLALGYSGATVPRRLNKQVRDVWERLNYLRAQAFGPGDRWHLDDALHRGIDPDGWFDHINGPARPVPDEIGSGGWLQRMLRQENGSLGVARLDSKTNQEARADARNFQTRLGRIKDPAKVLKLEEEIAQYLFDNFNLDTRAIQLYAGDPQRMIDLIGTRAKHLASDVYEAVDTPQWVKDEIAAMRAAGYKPVVGTHIGHLWDGTLPDIGDLGDGLTLRRRIAGHLGLNPDAIPTRVASQDARIRILRSITDLVRSGKVTLPPRATAETIMSVADEVLEHSLGSASEAVVALTKTIHRRGIKALAEERGIESFEEAAKQYRIEIARALQVRDIPRKKFIKILSTPAKGTTRSGGQWEWAGVSEEDAAKIYQAVLKGYRRPGYMMGWQAIEDWARSGFGVGDKVVNLRPGSNLLQASVSWPNRLVQLRNDLRFRFSPMFDFRRIAKQNFKMNLEGIRPTLSPLGRMVKDGTLKEDHARLARIFGERHNEAFDDADRYLYQQSIFGLYNSRHYEAYAARELARQGLDDEAIRKKLIKVFSYGTADIEGRSALERTVNTIFFPFSFEKTLLRNTGMYLLDRPAQTLMLTASLEAYRQADQNHHITQWVEDHLPLLTELQRLNAFAHGISPGELGGINAPLLNLFLPQQWGHQLSVDNLNRFLPVFKDFNRVFNESIEQAHIGANATLNLRDKAIETITEEHRSVLDPYRPMVTGRAQIRDAVAMRNSLVLALQPVIAHNRAHPDAQILFPDNPDLPAGIQGQPVNKTNIGLLVKRWYPDYSPDAGITYAKTQAQTAAEYVANQKDPARRQLYGQFVQLANKAAGHLNRGDYDTAKAAAIIGAFRSAAVQMASDDSSFLAFYNDHYRYLLGPLTAIQAVN